MKTSEGVDYRPVTVAGFVDFLMESRDQGLLDKLCIALDHLEEELTTHIEDPMVRSTLQTAATWTAEFARETAILKFGPMPTPIVNLPYRVRMTSYGR